VAYLSDALIALKTPRARDTAESTGMYLTHPASKTHSAYLRIGVGPSRDGATEVFIYGIARRPRRAIVLTSADWSTCFTRVNLGFATSVVSTNDE